MLSMILLRDKPALLNLMTDMGLTDSLVVLFSKYVTWLTTDSLGNHPTDDDIVKLFKMKYNEEKQVFCPTIDDFECKFKFPAVCAINSVLDDDDHSVQHNIFYVDDVMIKSLVDELGYVYRPITTISVEDDEEDDRNLAGSRYCQKCVYGKKESLGDSHCTRYSVRNKYLKDACTGRVLKVVNIDEWRDE